MEKDKLQRANQLSKLSLDWYDLFEQTRDFCMFTVDGFDDWRKAFNPYAFAKCIKETYQYFFADKERPQILTPSEIEVYGYIFAYSKLWIPTDCDESEKFYASAYVAEEMADAICNPNSTSLDGNKLIRLGHNRDGEIMKYEYDIESGDLSDFIKYATRFG